MPRETDPGLEIGRANDGESFVALMFLNTLDGSPGTLHFKFSFIPDPFEDARFKSASFTVMFSGECTDGTSFPLSILDTVPPCRPAGTIHQNSPYGPIAVASEIQSQGSRPIRVVCIYFRHPSSPKHDVLYRGNLDKGSAHLPGIFNGFEDRVDGDAI